MKILEVELSKEQVLGLPESTRVLFIIMGHITNEINALTKFTFWSANAKCESGAEENGRDMNILLFMRLLAGKLFEAWEVYEKFFFGTGLSKIYEPLLDETASEALKSLKKYFGKDNLAHKLRNKVAFHYSPKVIDASLEDLENPLFVYLDKSAAPNNLFLFAEDLVSNAVKSILGMGGDKNSFTAITGELFNVSANFVTVADGLMDAILKHNRAELRMRQPREIKLNDLVKFDKYYLPWFSDTTDLKSS
jgi:hypothetical protein